jgi:hypothetical protein
MPLLRQLFAAAFLLLLLSSISWAEENDRIPGATYLLDATMATSDGTKLVMDIILPPSKGPYPVILWRTPYNKDGVTYGEARQFVEAGYAAVGQDTRGRFKSEGAWDAFRYERRDGFETHEWIGRQEWCNGSIGLAGGSYLGFTQCISAPEGSKYLKAMVPEVPWGDTYHDCIYRNGAMRWQTASFWGGTQQLVKVNRPQPWPDYDKEGLFFHLPLSCWDDCIGERVQYLRDWVAHPTHDEYWKDHEVGDRIENLPCPALYIGGWFDIFTDGVLNYWNDARTRAKSEKARKNQYLVMGPWTHGGPAKDGKVGDLNFGPQSSFERSHARMDFFDEMLMGSDTGFSNRAPLRIFVMGKNLWRDEQEWPLARTGYRDLFLGGSGPANGTSSKGGLSWAKCELPQAADTFVYDPADPVPTNGGSLLWHTAGPRNQAEVEARQDVLVYSTDVLDETLEVTGPVHLKLFAATTVPDTDFTAKLVDVYPGVGGTEMPYGITEGIQRASFRESETHPSPVEPGKVIEYDIDLGNTSNAFLPGHRVRMEVSSSNFPRFDRNPNTGHPHGADDVLAKATQTIHRSALYPSRLVLPVIPN